MIRFGIVGAGGIAEQFVRDMNYCDDAVITSIASRSLDKANKFKEKHNIEFAYGSYEEMAKSDKIDAVYIATPHSHHMEYSILFMNNKKHVLCEKAFAANLKQAEAMFENAQKNNVLIMEAMWTKFLPATIKIRELVQSGELGNLKHAYIEFGFDLMHVGGDQGRLFNMDLAGGSILDIGVYPVAFLSNITNQPIKSIDAKATFFKTGVDLECNINIVFEDDSTATLVSSFLEDRNKPAVLEFEKGTIIAEHFSRSRKLIVNGEEMVMPIIAEGFKYQIDSFVETIKKGKIENDIMTYDETRKSMKIMDDIREVIGLKYPFE